MNEKKDDVLRLGATISLQVSNCADVNKPYPAHVLCDANGDPRELIIGGFINLSVDALMDLAEKVRGLQVRGMK